MTKIIDLILNKYKYVIIILLLITIPLGYILTQYKFFNHLDIYFEKDDPELVFYKNFQEKYGNEELAVIVFKVPDIITNINIEIIRKISKKINTTEGIQRVFSLTEAEEAIGKDDSISFNNIIPEGVLDNQALELLRKKILNNNYVSQHLISSDLKTTAVLIELEPTKDNDKKQKILHNIMKYSKKIAGDKIDLKFAGVPYVEVEMNYLSEKDFKTFIPVILTLIFFITVLLLKKFLLAVLCQINLFLCLIWGIGLFTLCGESFNMVTTVMSALLLAIAVADSIHILTHYRESYNNNGGDHSSAVSSATKSVWLPCFYTSLTTGFGFFSFLTSSIRPVKIMGIFTSISVMLAFVISISFLPVALMLLKKRFSDNPEKKSNGIKLPENNKTSIFNRTLLKTANFTTIHYKALSALFVVLIISTIIGIFKIKLETNLIKYIPEDNKIKTDFDFIEENLGGTIPFVILIQAKSEKYAFNQYESLKIIDGIQNDLMTNIKQFTQSFSITDYYKEINQAFNNGEKKYYKIPENHIDILEYYELGDIDVLDRIISSDMMEARLSFQSRWDTNETARKMYNFITSYMTKKLQGNYTFRITGLSFMYLNMEFNLKQSQIKSFSLALLIIFFMMFFVCKNIKLTLICIIPNLFPIAMTLGIMGWLNIPLDISTIMIASITLGIAVDDTIHFITWFKRNCASGLDVKSSIIKTYKDVGKPITITSFVLFLGFFVLILGSLKPTQAFGVLTAMAMIFALVGDLVILPAILMFFRKKL